MLFQPDDVRLTTMPGPSLLVLLALLAVGLAARRRREVRSSLLSSKSDHADRVGPFCALDERIGFLARIGNDASLPECLLLVFCQLA